ncbi:MAG: NAD(P)-dependent oxidoreductase [Bryobacteraceae bacterium]|nr:NAD(P)-dependent oxidoreductase [Bryobacteraceae bacterium]
MANLGYLGLGIMGYPMARNLRRAGHNLRAWSHTAAKAQKLAEEEGAVACASPKEAAEGCDCIFSCVGDTKMSEQVILGPGGIVEGTRAGAVVADISTISASASVRIGEKLAERGIRFLDAPCTGSKLGAEGGKLTFMIGGDQGVFESVRPFFEPMGQQLFYCGGPGAGLKVKLAQNLIQSNVLQAFNEGMVLATKAGVDPQLMLDVINNTAARSGLIAFKAPFVFRGDFSTHFSVKWMHKDIVLAMDLSDELQVPVPITGVTRQMFLAAIARGFGDDDFTSSIKVLEEIAGVEVRKL